MIRRSLLPVLLAGLLPLGWAGARSRNEEGNRLYREGRYKEALQAYTEAQVRAPDSPVVRYNLGNVLYRAGRFAEALRQYDSAREAEGAPRLDAAYNAGNAAYGLRDYPLALARYTEVLLADPARADARRNLELTLRRMKEKEEGRNQPEEQPPEGTPPGPPDQEPLTREEMSRQQAQRILDSLEDQEVKALREADSEEERGGPARYGDW